MPFGLSISNAVFGKGLEAAFSKYAPGQSIYSIIPNDVHVYVDDILISSETFEKHLQSLEWVFDKIANANLTLKYKKCHFVKN